MRDPSIPDQPTKRLRDDGAGESDPRDRQATDYVLRDATLAEQATKRAKIIAESELVTETITLDSEVTQV